MVVIPRNCEWIPSTLTHRSQSPKRHLDRFNGVTNTDHATCYVCSNMSHLVHRMQATRPKNVTSDIFKCLTFTYFSAFSKSRLLVLCTRLHHLLENVLL